MVVDPDPDEIYSKRKERISQLPKDAAPSGVKYPSDGDTGEKISFFRFPDDDTLRKQWLHAIRRAVGPDFAIKEGTRVCSRHFKPEDLKRSLNN